MSKQSEIKYHELDPSTPWYDWLCYCEICHQLNVPGQPKMGRFLADDLVLVSFWEFDISTIIASPITFINPLQILMAI